MLNYVGIYALFLFTLFINNTSFVYKKSLMNSLNTMIMKKESIANKLSFLYTPKTENQKTYYNYLVNKNSSIIISVGPAGTGKTLLACCSAIKQLKNKDVDKIILTRPVVSVEEDIGFLPGNLVTKMDPWTRPIIDVFNEYYPVSEVTNMVKNGIIEISPLGYMRGRTFKNSYIIADEMQNSSPNQMFMLLTRIGINSKMVITGDLAQSDRQVNNGLKDLITKYKTNPGMAEDIHLVELSNVDIQRSKLVDTVIKLYEAKPTISNSNVFDAALIPKKHYKEF